jgi:hypothetical protein
VQVVTALVGHFLNRLFESDLQPGVLIKNAMRRVVVVQQFCSKFTSYSSFSIVDLVQPSRACKTHRLQMQMHDKKVDCKA